MAILGLALAGESLIGVYLELIVIGKFLIFLDIFDGVDEYAGVIASAFYLCLAVGLNSEMVTSQLWLRYLAMLPIKVASIIYSRVLFLPRLNM